MSSDEQLETFNRWVGYMPRLDGIPDRELLILKIHLIVEEALYHLLGLRLGVETELSRSVSLQFAQLCAISLAGKNVCLKEAVDRLNVARNKAAHRLDDPEFDRHVDAFVEAARRLPGGNQVVTSIDTLESVRQAGNHTIGGVFDEASPHWKI